MLGGVSFKWFPHILNFIPFILIGLLKIMIEIEVFIIIKQDIFIIINLSCLGAIPLWSFFFSRVFIFIIPKHGAFKLVGIVVGTNPSYEKRLTIFTVSL